MVEKEKSLAVIAVLENGIDETKNGFSLDEDYAKEKELTSQEIQNSENYLPELDKKDVKSIKEES